MKKYTLLILSLCFFQWSSGQNYSLNFDGSNDAVSLGNNFRFETTDRFTVEAWVRVSESGFQQIVSKLDQNFTGWGLQIADTGALSGYLFSEYGVNSRFTVGTQDLTDDQWHHVAMTWDGVDNISLFVDGFLEDLAVYNINGTVLGPISNDSETHIGNYHADGATGEHILGNIDDVRIWNIRRSPTEIQENYLSELSGIESNLIGYYKFDVPNSSCDVQDCSTSEIHGERLGLNGGNDLPQFSDETPNITNMECGNSNSCTLAVDTIDILNDLILYPNPTINEFHITGQLSSNEILVSIYNTTGLLVKSLTSVQRTFSISELPSGLYFVNIGIGDQMVTKKLVKE